MYECVYMHESSTRAHGADARDTCIARVMAAIYSAIIFLCQVITHVIFHALHDVVHTLFITFIYLIMSMVAARSLLLRDAASSLQTITVRLICKIILIIL